LHRHRDETTHAAIRVDAEHLERLAAIRPVKPAGVTVAAAQVRLDSTAVAGLHAGADPGVEQLHPEVGPEDARVAEKRLPSCKGVQISAADADAVNAHEGAVWRRGGRCDGLTGELAGLLEGDLSHGEI